jgi:hypothetical protein
VCAGELLLTCAGEESFLQVARTRESISFFLYSSSLYFNIHMNLSIEKKKKQVFKVCFIFFLACRLGGGGAWSSDFHLIKGFQGFNITILGLSFFFFFFFFFNFRVGTVPFLNCPSYMRVGG